METTKSGRVVRIMNNNLKNEMIEDGEDDDDETYGESTRKKKVTGKRGLGSGSMQACCQVDGCTNDMINCKTYHQRHKVCEVHSKAPVVFTGGGQQRFCQQCSRFHDITEFDDAKRSCRMRLAGHNERRRKTSYETYRESS